MPSQDASVVTRTSEIHSRAGSAGRSLESLGWVEFVCGAGSAGRSL